ncbi:WD-40 repeat protein [Candidatus Sulfopaludibacter sp. SbA3]|nr:WD-40 repeat protein [Candidatus Sulfopaludibacter sp. SbA3]
MKRLVGCALTCPALFAASLNLRPPVTALAFSPDGKSLVSSGPRSLLVWDAATNKLTRKIPIAGVARAITFRPDGHTLAVAEGVPGRSGAVSLIDFESGAVRVLEKTADEMLAVAFSRDGTLLAAGGSGGTVEVWTLPGNELAATLKGHSGWVTGLAFSPDGKFLASSSLDRSVRIWDPVKWTERMQLPQALVDPINAVAIAPEGDVLIFAEGGDTEHALRLWRTQNAAGQTRPFDTGACVPLATAFQTAPQHSRMIAACSDNTLRVMAIGGNTVLTLSGHTDWVYAAAVSADGQKVASGSGDGTVKIWNFAGKLVATLTEDAK